MAGDRYTYQGDTKTLKEWAEDSRCTVPLRILKRRLDRKMGIGQALSRELTYKEKEAESNRPFSPKDLYSFAGKTMSLYAWSKDPLCSVSSRTLYERIREGWSFEEALLTPAFLLRGRRPGGGKSAHKEDSAQGSSREGETS